MKGRVEIYQGYIKNGRATVDEVPIHVDSNLIVDGAKEHIVDFLTRIPAPSGLLDASNPASGNVNHSYDASNFGVRAISFSPNSQAFQRTTALAATSGFVFNPATSGLLSPLPITDGLTCRTSPILISAQPMLDSQGEPSRIACLKTLLFHLLLIICGMAVLLSTISTPF